MTHLISFVMFQLDCKGASIKKFKNNPLEKLLYFSNGSTDFSQTFSLSVQMEDHSTQLALINGNAIVQLLKRFRRSRCWSLIVIDHIKQKNAADFAPVPPSGELEETYRLSHGQHVTCTHNLVKVTYVIFEGWLWADRHTDKQKGQTDNKIIT